MLSTKEFADLCKTTKRTIIHYDQIGLLKPAKLDGLNRLYLPRQVLTFEKIALLQSVGFPLKVIKNQLKNRKTLTSIFRMNKRIIVEKQRRINQQMQRIDEILNNLEKNKNILDPKIKKIKPYSFYGIGVEGKYANINVYCEDLAEKIGDKKFKFTYFVIFKDFYVGYSPVRSKMIIGAKPEKNIHLKQKNGVTIFHAPKYKAITSLHKGSHGSLGYVWEFMCEYIQKNKLTPDKSILNREIYIINPKNEEFEENYITELQAPIITN